MQYFISVIIFGDSGIDKLKNLRYFPPYRSKLRDEQLGATSAFYQCEINMNSIQFHIIDIGQQTRLTPLRMKSIQNASGCLLFFDVKNEDSFFHMKNCIEELWRNNKRGVVPMVILGNQNDSFDDITISQERIRKYVRGLNNIVSDYGFEVQYLETSVDIGYNIDKAFRLIGLQHIEAIQSERLKLDSTVPTYYWFNGMNYEFEKFSPKLD